MSLIDSLAHKGISIVEGIGKGVQFVGTRSGVIPVQWQHDKRPGLVWRVPEPDSIPSSERITIASIFSKHQPIVVREFERAIVLDNGKFFAEMPGGAFDIAKVPIKGVIEIIWVSMSQSQHRWGVGGVMSADGITVGAFGTLYLQVVDATKFVLNLVTGQQAFSDDKIEAWIKNLVMGIMRREIALREIRALTAEREGFIESCREKLAPLFADWGLEFKHLEMVELNLPPEYREVVASVARASYARQTAVLNAQTNAEVIQIEAQASATAKLMSGSADVQIMALMQAQGLDPVKMETIKVLMEYAKAPSGNSGGALISGDLYKPQVFAMLSQTLTDPTIPSDVKQVLRQSYPQQTALIPAPVQSTATPHIEYIPATPPKPDTQPVAETQTERALTEEKIEQMIDSLDMQLSEGKLSETLYNRLREKWETKLAKLKAV